MRQITIVMIPEGAHATKQFKLPTILLKLVPFVVLSLAGYLSYVISDYLELLKIRSDHRSILAENEGLKGEARLLLDNLEDVKQSLRRIQNYSSKLGELTSLQFKDVRAKTGIGPLSPAEYSIAKKRTGQHPDGYVPLGVDLDKLVFRPVFDKLNNLGRQADDNALELQRILSNLSQKKSLLSSIPTIVPVGGWIASGFGSRVSPFTGQKMWHMGIDIAATSGTPIYAPADGVVIFSGNRSGFGNFIMIAHGFGIVTHYGHNTENMVQLGQRVQKGDQIATVGMTGRTTGPHLHYEVVLNGKNVDPKKFILDVNY